MQVSRHSRGWLWVYFLFYHSLAQCADWLSPAFPAGRHRIWGIRGAAVPLFGGLQWESASLTLYGGTSCWGLPGPHCYIHQLPLWRECCSCFRGALAAFFQAFGQGRLLSRRGGQPGFKALLPRFAAVFKLLGGGIFGWLLACAGVWVISVRKEGGTNHEWHKRLLFLVQRLSDKPKGQFGQHPGIVFAGYLIFPGVFVQRWH